MWDWIVNILFELLKLIQTFAVDWGLSIIILVVIIRLLLTPLMLKSTKSTARMQVLQPKMLEIQERYADDPQRQAEEMQKFYSENKFNPMAGCLPLLIQMPILFALFTLLRNLPQYFNDGTFSFFNILPDLTTTPSASFADGFMVALPALVCLILFAVLTLIPQLYMSRNQTGQQAQSMRMMAVVMTVMMLWMGWSLPVGVLLYYDVSSAWQVIQQIFVTQKVIDKAKADEEAAKLIVAYEPVWAIGTGMVATPDTAQQAAKAIRDDLGEMFGPAVADTVRILYGGSGSSKNATHLIGEPDVDGFLIGGASLDPGELAKIARLTLKATRR